MCIFLSLIQIAVQILYDGHHYLITIVYIKGVLHLYDNVSKGSGTVFPRSWVRGGGGGGGGGAVFPGAIGHYGRP